MMIKPSGFCTNHSGKVEEVSISPGEKENFEQYFRSMLAWMIRLAGSEKFFSYTHNVLNYTEQLIESSLHYIRLLSDLLHENHE